MLRGGVRGRYTLPYWFRVRAAAEWWALCLLPGHAATVVALQVLYVEYLSVAVFLQSITGSSPHASECVGAAGCAMHIISGAVAYAVAVAYFILRYTAFFGEESYHTVIDGIGFGRHALRMGRAPLLVLIAHVLGNTLSAFLLLPAGSASAGRLVVAPGTTVRTVLLSPLLEELIFRGLIPAVIHNRCRSPRPFTANAMFSVIHMWNLLGTGQKFEVVVLQCGMAFVLGFYYATRHTTAGGSLWECIALHSTNNLLAVVFDATHEQVGSTALIAGVVLTAGLYGMATLGEWYHGQHSTATATNAD